ncbi:hypothetical protein JA1_002122 [Spathaspora sp. JA1]|nr:hypothetical protein JA1_002122 [Spathaspora sp. JA1]
MASSFFKSKTFRFSKSSKNISSPGPTLTSLAPLSPERPLKLKPQRLQSRYSHLVLAAKYEFQAEREDQLTIKPNDHLILINRPGNGWLEVHLLDNKEESGLVPASFVEIVVNDCVNPISLTWLTEFETKEMNVGFNELTGNEPVYPVSVVIDKAFQSLSKKFIYKMKLIMSNTDTIYLGKRYQDFYNLQLQIMENFPFYQGNIPKLPPPLIQIPQSSRLKFDKELVNHLIHMIQGLNDYFRGLLRSRDFQKSREMFDFIFAGPYHVSQINEEVDEFEINKFLFPSCIDVELYVKNLKSRFSTTAPLPPINSVDPLRLKERKLSNQYINFKYSTYINQQSGKNSKELVQSSSVFSFDSYTSVIDVYDQRGEQDSNEEEEDDDDASSTSVNTPELSPELSLSVKRDSLFSYQQIDSKLDLKKDEIDFMLTMGEEAEYDRKVRRGITNKNNTTLLHQSC